MTVPPDARALRLTLIIARLNIGGPAIQAIDLAGLLGRRGYLTHLVRGVEADSEGNMDHLARELGVQPTLVSQMRRDPGQGDLLALARLVQILRRDQPDIVHTHAAKAGTLGRLAALVAHPRRSTRPVLVHTFHGHSLTGYFTGRTAGFYRRVERLLARHTDRLIAVSPEVRDDLVQLGVAAREKFEVIPLGFDLSPFLDDSRRAERRAALRAEWGVAPEAKLVSLVARLVPIKRVDRFLAVARRLADRPGIRFAIVGGGESAETLRDSPDGRTLGAQVVWAGFRMDVADVCFASDVIMLTSDNEGTPTSLIEAQAAAVPVVATDVGGVRSAVLDGGSGLLAAASDLNALAEATARILDDPQLAQNMSQTGRSRVADAFGRDRLLDDHDRLYRELIRSRRR
jgi:glycosyltransferase involved in cell wall biosynthesis